MKKSEVRQMIREMILSITESTKTFRIDGDIIKADVSKKGGRIIVSYHLNDNDDAI